MADEPVIIVHQKTIRNKAFRFYEWRGAHWKPIKLRASNISELPFYLIQIDYDAYTDVGIYIRKDRYYPFGLILSIKQRISNFWRLFYYRVIMTLNIWNLAHTPEGCVPSWKDIFKR